MTYPSVRQRLQKCARKVRVSARVPPSGVVTFCSPILRSAIWLPQGIRWLCVPIPGWGSYGRRGVYDWYPIHDWTLARVWGRMATPGSPLAVYAAGMSRLSCRFCVLSSRADLLCSARLSPALADRYAEAELRIGHRFRTDLTMADVIAEARDAGQLALIPLAAIA
jgi:hypothetical protein